MVKEAVKPTKAVAVIEKTPNEMIRFAVDKGADLDKLKQVMALQFEWEANEAKKAYNKAMVEVSQKMPSVKKTLSNPQTKSKYASLDLIIQQTKKIYTECGFSISFYEGITAVPEHIRICADVVHALGHKETYFYDVPLDGKGIQGNANMTKIHAKASSTSYARRYLMCMIWNIPTGDDNDAQTEVDQSLISDKQLGQLRDLMADKNITEVQMCKYLKIDSMESIPSIAYGKALSAVQNAKGGSK